MKVVAGVPGCRQGFPHGWGEARFDGANGYYPVDPATVEEAQA